MFNKKIIFVLLYCIFLFVFIWVRLLSILHDHSLFFIPATSAIDRWLRRISIPDFIQYFFILSLFLRKSPDYPFKCWVLNKGITGTIFIMSLVWLGIEPGTSRTECQHSTTRLSRRQFVGVWDITFHQPTDWPPDWTTTWNGPTNWLTTWLNDHSKWSNKLTDNLPAQPLEMVQQTDWQPDRTTTQNGPTNWLTTCLHDHSKWSNQLTDNLPARPLEMVQQTDWQPACTTTRNGWGSQYFTHYHDSKIEY